MRGRAQLSSTVTRILPSCITWKLRNNGANDIGKGKTPDQTDDALVLVARYRGARPSEADA